MPPEGEHIRASSRRSTAGFWCVPPATSSRSPRRSSSRRKRSISCSISSRACSRPPRIEKPRSGQRKPVRPWGRGSDRLLRTLGGAPGEKIRSALLGRNKPHFSLVTSVKTERSGNRGMHNPSAANIESGSQVLVLIKRREAFVRELDHKGQGCIVERL